MYVLIMAVALKILAQIYMKINSATTNLESLLVCEKRSVQVLPILLVSMSQSYT